MNPDMVTYSGFIIFWPLLNWHHVCEGFWAGDLNIKSTITKTRKMKNTKVLWYIS
jgi:hypothetical protein